MNGASFSLDGCVARMSSFFPDQLEMKSDQAHGAITERWELQNKAEHQVS
jgi:hypothetical protein